MRMVVAVAVCLAVASCSFRMSYPAETRPSVEPLCWTSPVGPLLDGTAATVLAMGAIFTPRLFGIEVTSIGPDGQIVDQQQRQDRTLMAASFAYIFMTAAGLLAVATVEGVRRNMACSRVHERHRAWKRANPI